MRRLRMRFDVPAAWQGAPGSAWRGGLGHALKNAAAKHCAHAYPLFFPAADQRNATATEEIQIAPFVLDPGCGMESNTLYCTLSGPGTDHAALVTGALREAAANGIGPGRLRLAMKSIAHESVIGSGHWNEGLGSTAATITPLPALPETLHIEFLTPLRIRHQGQNVTPRNFLFADLATSLMRRASALHAQAHAGRPIDADWRALAEAARNVSWQSTGFHWFETERRSFRQQADMKLGGIVGSATLAGADIQTFWPVLWLGQWLHAGKNASFGFGKYRIACA